MASRIVYVLESEEEVELEVNRKAKNEVIWVLKETFNSAEEAIKALKKALNLLLGGINQTV